MKKSLREILKEIKNEEELGLVKLQVDTFESKPNSSTYIYWAY